MLLLSIQSACDAERIQVPWKRVAEMMGEGFTEASIVQHFTKLRSDRIAANKAVPPSLHQGNGGMGKPAERLVLDNQMPDRFPPVNATIPASRQAIEFMSVAREATDTGNRNGFECASDASSNVNKDKVKDFEPDHRMPDEENKGALNKTELQIACRERDTESDYEISDGGSSSLRIPTGSEVTTPETFSQDGDQQDDGIQDETQETENGLTQAYPFPDLIAQPAERSQVLDQISSDVRTGAYCFGIGPYHDRDPERVWKIPPPGPLNIKWGFSKDYYGPIPMDSDDPLRPLLLDGRWPRDVVERQYQAPNALPWEVTPEEPDPKLYHPAAWLQDKETCKPELLFHRRLRRFVEDDFPELRQELRKRRDYQEYMEKHREVPRFLDPTWNLPPTVAFAKGANYRQHGSGNRSVPPHGEFEVHGPLIQLEPELRQESFVDTENACSIYDDVDLRKQLPPIKCYDLLKPLTEEQLNREYGDWALT